jgi:hypothetical protein
MEKKEGRLRIGPLGKLGRFHSAAKKFLVYIVSIRLVRGLIPSITSWYAIVIHDTPVMFCSSTIVITKFYTLFLLKVVLLLILHLIAF